MMQMQFYILINCLDRKFKVADKSLLNLKQLVTTNNLKYFDVQTKD